jgi:hypothetical protein
LKARKARMKQTNRAKKKKKKEELSEKSLMPNIMVSNFKHNNEEENSFHVSDKKTWVSPGNLIREAHAFECLKLLSIASTKAACTLASRLWLRRSGGGCAWSGSGNRR